MLFPLYLEFCNNTTLYMLNRLYMLTKTLLLGSNAHHIFRLNIYVLTYWDLFTKGQSTVCFVREVALRKYIFPELSE